MYFSLSLVDYGSQTSIDVRYFADIAVFKNCSYFEPIYNSHGYLYLEDQDVSILWFVYEFVQPTQCLLEQCTLQVYRNLEQKPVFQSTYSESFVNDGRYFVNITTIVRFVNITEFIKDDLSLIEWNIACYYYDDAVIDWFVAAFHTLQQPDTFFEKWSQLHLTNNAQYCKNLPTVLFCSSAGNANSESSNTTVLTDNRSGRQLKFAWVHAYDDLLNNYRKPSSKPCISKPWINEC